MSVEITDCTIRDGGYLLNKNTDPEIIRGIIKGLSEAGIDFVETGFLQDIVQGETLVYHKSADLVKYLPNKEYKTNYLGFCDNSRYSIEHLEEYTGKSFQWLRISFAKHEVDDALEFCSKAMQKGYLVQCNPMDSISYTSAERKNLIHKVNTIMPASFSIVDTFGAMDMLDLEEVFYEVDDSLNKEIKIGLHSHDNLGLSCALAERLIELSETRGRDIIIDGSLLGMGRGAGNAKTELLVDYVNKHCGGHYNIEKILETIETYIVPLMSKASWGYDLPMFICGTMHAHVDNVYHLRDTFSCNAEDMYAVVSSLTPQQRTRYGKGYSKTDFSILDEQYDIYKKKFDK